MDRPLALYCDTAELTIGVHRVWVADYFEQRQVVDRIAVRAACVEVEVLASGERPDCGRFCLSVEDLTDESSGPYAVFDLGDRAQRAAQPEPPGHDLDQFDWRASDDPNRIAPLQMLFGQPAGPAPDPSGETLVVNLFTESYHFGDLQACPDCQRSFAHVGELADMFAPPTERDMLTSVASDLPTSDQSMAHHARPGMEQHRALDQGVIQIEERGAAHRA